MNFCPGICQDMSHVGENSVEWEEANIRQWKFLPSEGQQIEFHSSSKNYYLYNLGQSL